MIDKKYLISIFVLFVMFFSNVLCYANETTNQTKESSFSNSIGVHLEGVMFPVNLAWGISYRLWYARHGIELSGGGGEVYVGRAGYLYQLAKISYLHKINDEQYLGIGIGENRMDSSGRDIGINFNNPPTFEHTSYVENPIYLFHGINKNINDWASGILEIGYAITNVHDFLGDSALYPKNRFYLLFGYKIHF